MEPGADIKKEMIGYLKKEYRPLAIVFYGSYLSGTDDEYSDFDCMVIVSEKNRKHDDTFICGVQLDCFIYTVRDVQNEDTDLFLAVYDGEIILDTDNIAAELQEKVRRYVDEHSTVDDEEKKFIVSWIKKTMHRAEKNDDEGSFRALAFLWESLADYCILRDLYYFGSKKTVSYLKEKDCKGYMLYRRAITERTNSAIAAWAEYVAGSEPHT